MEQKIKKFIEYMEKDNPGIEAVALGDKEQVLLEHYFVKLHSRNIYSHTKSFMSTAAGIALEEGALTLEDPLVKYFPERETSAFSVKAGSAVIVISGRETPMDLSSSSDLSSRRVIISTLLRIFEQRCLFIFFVIGPMPFA